MCHTLNRNRCETKFDNLFPMYHEDLANININTLKDSPECARTVIYGLISRNLSYNMFMLFIIFFL